MPLEGSAIARAHSAEFIAAQRQRSRSLQRALQNPAVLDAAAAAAANPDGSVQRFDTNAEPQLFLIPSPVYGIPRPDDVPAHRARSPDSPRSKGKSLTGASSKRVPPAIQEAHESAVPVGAPSKPGRTTSAPDNASDSDQTAADRDIEAAIRDDELEDSEPIVGEPLYDAEKRKARIAEERAKAKSGQQGEKQEQDNNKKDEQKEDEFLVTLKGREHLNPHTWNANYRWFLTALAGLFVLNATFASSGPSQLLPSIITYFGVSQEVGVLTIALFVAGYCVGPLLWGPLSERYGRKIVFIVAFIPYVGFQVGCALSKNIGSLLVFRFLGGTFAASPLTNSGGLIADLWDADRRGIALAFFSLAPFAGPALAPIVSGALEVRGVDWRWMFWILAIFAGVCLAVIVLVLPETYVPYILHKEAKRLRKETGDSRWHSANEHPDHKVTLSETLHHTILKPFIMIAQEPMLLFMTLYLSFVYGIVYLLFEALPIVFQEVHGFNALEGGLVFLALPIGGTLATVIYAVYFNKAYMRKHHALKGKMVPPEERLKPLMVAAPLFAIAFFWFGWTYYKSINPASPIISVAVLGLCILWMFLSIFNYLIDSYLMNAASALAINTVCRSAFGAGFPLFATQMYNKLGVPGASSLLGGLAIVFMPMPFILYKYGRKIRMMSKNAMVID